MPTPPAKSVRVTRSASRPRGDDGMAGGARETTPRRPNGNEGTGTAQEPPTRSRPSNVEHDQSPSTATARTLEYPPATADEAQWEPETLNAENPSKATYDVRFSQLRGTRERERGAARIEQRDGRKADASLAERTARGGSRCDGEENAVHGGSAVAGL